ncbi:MAG: TolC family protein [Planctomycetes bacterium]|nr:TolC family protein [Planctomycetota bacterium]
MMLVPVALIIGTMGAVSLGGSEPATDANVPQTLSEYLRYAALNNAGLKAAFEEWKAALEQIPQAKALPDPRFTYGYFTEQLQTRQQVEIMQMFPWFGKIAARTDAAAAAAKAAQSRYEALQVRLFSDVKQAFYEYAYLAGATRVARENLMLMQYFEEVARTKHLAAAASHPDILRAQIEVARLQNDLITFERSRTPTVARLNALLNRPVDAPLPWPHEEPNQPAKVDRGLLMATLKNRNLELQAIGFDIERLDREVAVAKRNYYPDVGVGVQWMQMPMPEGGSANDVMIGFEINLPIWRSSYRAGELQARALARRARYERKNLENDLAARIERAIYEFENSGRQVKLYDEALVPRAQELIAASESAYLAGTIDFLNLISAQQELLQFRLERERFWADQQQRLAELEMLVEAGVPAVMDGGSPTGGRMPGRSMGNMSGVKSGRQMPGESTMR